MPTESYRFPTDGPVHLHVRSGRGTVEVIADDVPETLVDVSGRHDVGIVRVSASDDGRQVSVEVPRTWRPGGHAALRHHRARCPRGSTVDLGTASASITTRGVLAQADAKTASGALSIEQVEGDCRAHSASGDIELGTDRRHRRPQERVGRPARGPGRRPLHGRAPRPAPSTSAGPATS